MDSEYKLTPGFTDVDTPGWEITSWTDEAVDNTCHELFSQDRETDDAKAQGWADQVIGTRQTWRRVQEDPKHSGWYHFLSC